MDIFFSWMYIIVLSKPIGHGPPSIIASIFPEKFDRTSSNLVVVNLPDRFADGAAIGKLHFSKIFLKTGWAGILNAIVFKLEIAFLVIDGLLFFFFLKP